MTQREVRVRFAPSPTGALHIGGVRTALFNYLFAKKHGGKFILRIEDTDQTRYVEGAENYIIESLNWCGLHFDESVRDGGEYGPYRQSDRKAIYGQYAQMLIDNGSAYYAFDTPEELDAMREELKDQKSDIQLYNAHTRTKMRNSLTLPAEEVERLMNEGVQYVVRFKMPENKDIEVTDIIRGKVVFNTSILDDKVLFKSDGMPTYHLANVVDDYLMKISHVIRGEEWLPSLPLHFMLYNAFGWLQSIPQFAHLPLLLKPSGSGKLSKRDGDKMGFPVFPLEWRDPSSGEKSMGYREEGYFADAFINLLAFLGWNPGTEEEILDIEQLSELFSLEKVNKAGARFDPEKAKWFNHQYLIKKNNAELAKIFAAQLKLKGIEADFLFVEKVCGMMKERVNFVSELWNVASFLFVAPTEYDATVIKKRWKEDVPPALLKIAELLNEVEPFDIATTSEKVKTFIQANQLNMGQIMNCFRLALVGGSLGPDLFEMVELLGKNEVISRIKKAVEEIKL